MVVQAYTTGLVSPLCVGRYDNMLERFGTPCLVASFTLGIERIILALDRQTIASDISKQTIYIAWSIGNLPEAINM